MDWRAWLTWLTCGNLAGRAMEDLRSEQLANRKIQETMMKRMGEMQVRHVAPHTRRRAAEESIRFRSEANRPLGAVPGLAG